jgi:hypothetical protein
MDGEELHFYSLEGGKHWVAWCEKHRRWHVHTLHSIVHFDWERECQAGIPGLDMGPAPNWVITDLKLQKHGDQRGAMFLIVIPEKFCAGDIHTARDWIRDLVEPGAADRLSLAEINRWRREFYLPEFLEHMPC